MNMWPVYHGEVVFVSHQKIQAFTALPELSSAELPVKDDETVTNIFEKSKILSTFIFVTSLFSQKFIFIQ